MNYIAGELEIMKGQLLYKKFSDGLAVVLHPFFLAFGALFFEILKAYNIWLMTAAVFLCLLVPYLAVKHLAGDVYLKSRKSRILPLSISLLSYGVLCMIANNLSKSHLLWLCVAITIVLLLLTLLTFFIKASMHTAAFGGIITYLVANYFVSHDMQSLIWIAIAAILFLIVTLQRLHSHAHSLKEVVLGYLTGILPMILLLYLYPSLILQL